MPRNSRKTREGQFSSAFGRWASLGPYYAMFPVDFACKTIEKYCPEGGAVLDPFAGRGTSIIAAAWRERDGTGIEIHPAGWVYGQAKLNPAPLRALHMALEELSDLAVNVGKSDRDSLPEFFGLCYSANVLNFLLAARKKLNWRRNHAHRTLTAFILTYLHGKWGQALSNQLRQTKAMSPDYCIKWWKAHSPAPPKIDPATFLSKRIAWRYKYGVPEIRDNKVLLGDARIHLRNLGPKRKQFDLLFTSPPYVEISNYHYDQWLRLWLLGFPPYPKGELGPIRGKFASQVFYRELLEKVFSEAAPLLRRNATIYVRTDARPQTLNISIDILRRVFPSKSLRRYCRPAPRKSQTALYGDSGRKPGEIDLVFR